MGEPRRPEDEIVEFDFDASDGLPATPPSTAPSTPPSTPSLALEDDPFTALAGELSSTLAEDEGRTRRLAGDEQRRLAAARVGGVEMETLDPAALEQSLRADLLATDTASASGPRFIDVRATRTAPRLRRPGVLRRLLGGVATLLSTGADQSKLPRVFAGYLARTVSGALAVALIVGLAAGPAGSAFDATYAPEAALVRHTGGIVTRQITDAESGPQTNFVVDDATATGLDDAAMRFLDEFDAAVASGQTTAISARFFSAEAAAPWIETATQLHAAGGTRTYPYGDPKKKQAAFTVDGSDTIQLTYPGVKMIVDVAANGDTLEEQRGWALKFEYALRDGSWLLLSVTLLSS